MIRALALIMLASCGEMDAEPQLRYQCDVILTCGDEVEVWDETSACGTHDDIVQFARGWTSLCQALNVHRIQERECAYVICATLCPASKSEVVESCEE